MRLSSDRQRSGAEAVLAAPSRKGPVLGSNLLGERVSAVRLFQRRNSLPMDVNSEYDPLSVQRNLVQAVTMAGIVLLLCGCAAALLDYDHRRRHGDIQNATLFQGQRYGRLHEVNQPAGSPNGACHAGGSASSSAGAVAAAAATAAKALGIHKFLQHAAESSAQERYSMALAEGQALFRLESQHDAASAHLKHLEAQKRASIEYARDLQELAENAKATNEAFVEAMAPTRALEAEEEMVAMEAMRAKAAEHALARAKAGEATEAASALARQEAAARVTEKIRAKERQRHEELATDCSQVGHAPVKPPLPRRKTVARSHLYGGPADEERELPTSLEDAERGGVGSGGDAGSMLGWCTSSNSTSPLPSALQPAASSRSADSVGHGSPPRDINNLYPHASRVLQASFNAGGSVVQWVATSLTPRRTKRPLPPSAPPPTRV